MQLVELQDVFSTLRQHEIALFAISYDPVSALADFAERNAIEYPLLGDEGSHVIRALGLLDEALETHHAEFGGTVRDEQRGVCYPGVFILDERGVVSQRRFQRNYRVRESGASLLAQVLDISPSDETAPETVDGPLVQIAARLDSPTYWRYQRLRVIVDLAIAPGAHLFAHPTPAEYTPLSIEVTADRAVIGAPSLPAPVPFQLAGHGEQLWVHAGQLRIAVPLEFVMDRGEPMGDQTIGVRLRYQACTATICEPPREVMIQLVARERPSVA
ncbi:MAG: redoxin domain-containing protein [Chloroflexota bacterium]